MDGEKGQESLRVVYGIEEDDINCATQASAVPPFLHDNVCV